MGDLHQQREGGSRGLGRVPRGGERKIESAHVEATEEAMAREEPREQLVKKQAAKPVPPAIPSKSRASKQQRTKLDSDSEIRNIFQDIDFFFIISHS